MWVNFLAGFWGVGGGDHVHFPAKRTQNYKPRLIRSKPSIDNGSLSFQKKVSVRLAPKWLSYGQITYTYIWNNWLFKMLLAQNLAEYHFFLWHQFYLIGTIKLYILCKFRIPTYLKNGPFEAQKPLENDKNRNFSKLRLQKIRIMYWKIIQMVFKQSVWFFYTS